MGKAMTMAEIETEYDSEWVLIDEPLVSGDMQILGGKLVYHSPDRQAVHKKAKELRLKHFALLRLGDGPEDMVFALDMRFSPRRGLIVILAEIWGPSGIGYFRLALDTGVHTSC